MLPFLNLFVSTVRQKRKEGNYVADSPKQQMIQTWYREYGSQIYRYIFKMVQDTYQAEDLTQETFIRAYEKMDSISNINQPKTWIYSIAHNVTMDYLRRKTRFSSLLQFLKPIKIHSPSAESMMEMKEDSKRILKELSMLKPSYREVFILRKIHGFSVGETAMILGWTEGKVKITLSRSIKKLQSNLDKEDIFYETS